MRPLVSIITPTFSRDEFLVQTLRWVQEQTYPNIEWLVLDDSPAPSRSLAGCGDPRLRYEHIGQRLTIGEKRNRLVNMARGEFVAHFDDDDYYAPRFLETMVAGLETQEADFANLSSWYLFDVRHDLFGFWYLRQTTGVHYLCHADGLRLTQFTAQNNATLLNNYLGYGFTYVYRRAVWEAAPFPALDWGEDAQFVTAAAARFQLLSFQDQSGLVLHVLHENSTSSCFPQYRLPTFLLQTLFGSHHSFLETLRQRRQRSDERAASFPATSA
jgi:glycosyltransferase involved in cell wall biosynthesis